MTRRVTLALVIALTVPVAGQSSRANHVLDVLLVDVGKASTPSAGVIVLPAQPGFGATTGSKVSDINLRVTLESIDRFAYETGDSIVFETFIENIGKQPVVLPWSPDPALFPLIGPQMPGSRFAGLYLEARASNQQLLARLEGQPLFGVPGVYGSLQVLGPGEKAWIRAPGAWRTDEHQLRMLLTQPEGRVRLSAVLQLVDPHISARSENSLEAAVRARLPQ